MCAVKSNSLCVSVIVRAVHQSSSKLGDTPLVRLDLFESLPSRRFGCRASTTNSTTKSRSTSLYNGGAVSRGGCRALQLYSAPERSTSLQLYSALHSTSSTPSLRILHCFAPFRDTSVGRCHGDPLPICPLLRQNSRRHLHHLHLLRPNGQSVPRSVRPFRRVLP